MKGHLTAEILVALIMTVFLTACGSNTNEVQDGQGAGELPPVAVVKAREALATHLELAVEAVPFGSHERAEWTDSCLGLGGPAESCLAAIHPGWQVNFEVDGISYEVRTDEQGDIVRIKNE
jgi:hypothetical protein